MKERTGADDSVCDSVVVWVPCTQLLSAGFARPSLGLVTAVEIQ